MKVWKRYLAVALAWVMLFSSVNVSEAAGTYDTENFIWTANDAEIVAEYYGLDDAEAEALFCDAVNGGYEYTISAPYDNGAEDKKDLIAVDYLDKKVYAKALYTDGYAWLPKTAVLSAEGEEKEVITLTEGVCNYNDVEYYASEAFTYNGYSYTVEVTYQMQVGITSQEQERILNIPVVLAQTAVNLEENLKDVYKDVLALNNIVPALYKLLSLEFTEIQEVEKEETGDTEEAKKEETGEAENEESGEAEEIEVIIPALDPQKDATVIAVIQALYDEYMENENLILLNYSEEYGALAGRQILAYTFENGSKIQESAYGLYILASILNNSSSLNKAVLRLSQEEEEVYQELYLELQGLRKILRDLIGGAMASSELAALMEIANWSILRKDVQAQIFTEDVCEQISAADYTGEIFAKLEKAVYGLRSSEPRMPAVETETLIAAEIEVGCDITIYDISVSVNAATVSGEVESRELQVLNPYGTTITLLEGTSEEAIRQAIEATGIEALALSEWNGLNSEYQIHTGYYDREESGLSGALYSDLECVISYTPKYYPVKTNFRGNEKLPYGFKFEFPTSTDEDISFDYIVETESGSKVGYNEGVMHKVTQAVSITQTQGTEKKEYRLYDFLVRDPQYSFSDTEEQILLNSAVSSPTLKIRMPDGSTVSEITEENGIYHIEANDYASGIYGMKWNPHKAAVMSDNTVLTEVEFDENTASWTVSGFSHVVIFYQLKIEKLNNSLTGGALEENSVLYALNLPYNMAINVQEQNEILCGDGEITSKVIYEELEAVNSLMNSTMLSVIAGCMKTEEELDAMLRLQGSEDKDIKGQNGQSLGCGGWNTASDELALYTYLKLCADTEWSLAAYYEQGLYEKIALQAGLVADCLEVIVNAQNFVALAEQFNYQGKVEEVKAVLPKLKLLSESIGALHPAINMKDDRYEELIQLLLTAEIPDGPAEASNGIYVYTNIRKNPEGTGSMSISVQVGTQTAQPREFMYVTENGTHVLTQEDADLIQQHIADLENELGMTEEEKVYYNLAATTIPKAGDTVGKNAIVSLTYTPKEYTVTMKGVSDSEYKATFKYMKHTSDYVIELPPYSTDREADTYYCYWVDQETPIKVANGNNGYYTFTKEDLTVRFVNSHFELYGREAIEIPKVTVTAGVTYHEELIRGFETFYDAEAKAGMILLDAAPNGLKISQFKELVTFTDGSGNRIKIADKDIDNSNRNPSYQDYLANGSTVTCTVYDENEYAHEITYVIIIMGDLNKNGKVDSNDAWVIGKNYLGTAEDSENFNNINWLAEAADMNGNGISTDSNDALQIIRKCLYWKADGEEQYASSLIQ